MNKIMLMGRLVKDVELVNTQSGKTLAKFSIAVNKNYKVKNEKKTADFFNCVAWEKTAEFCNKYYKKGQQVVVIGRMEDNKYVKDGQTIYNKDVLIEETYFADSKKKEDNTIIDNTIIDNELPF
jgi:single-strand DNA-binding protein